MKRLFTVLLAIGLMANVAYAHNGMEHVMGTVASVRSNSISVTTMGAKSIIVIVNSSTKYSRGGIAIQLKDLMVGEHVVIHATGRDETLTAAFVKVGKIKAMAGMKIDDKTSPPQQK